MSSLDKVNNMTDEPTQPTILLSRKQLQKHIQKLTLREGDVILIKESSPTARREVIQGIVDALGKVGKRNIILVVVDDFDDLSILNEQEMAKHGWYRVPALQKLIHTKADAEPEKEVDDDHRPDGA